MATSTRTFTLTLILFYFLLSRYGIVEGSFRSFKIGVHFSESFGPIATLYDAGKTIDDSDWSPPAKSLIEEEYSSSSATASSYVTSSSSSSLSIGSELLSPTPAYSIDGSSDSSGRSSSTLSSSSSIGSGLLSLTPAYSIDGSSDSSGRSNAIVIVACAVAVLLAVLVIGLLWYIYCNRSNGRDDVYNAITHGRDDVYNASTHGRSTTAKNMLPPVPAPTLVRTPVRVHTEPTYPPATLEVNPRGGAATVTDQVDSVVSSDVPVAYCSSDQYLTPPNTLQSENLTISSFGSSSLGGAAPDSAVAITCSISEGRNVASVELEGGGDTLALRASEPEISHPGPPRDTKFGLTPFSLEVLRHATHDFSADNLLGEGTFGKVYKGRLEDDTIVAVKVLKVDNMEGDRDFINEVTAISSAKHKNIVGLLGYCISDTKRCIVCEFVENGSLKNHLRGGKGIITMEWPLRMMIARGIAKGLAYLHNECPQQIIHRDVKPDNILLDHKFVAKVADFGIAKLCSDSFGSYIATNCIKGTRGYLDPTYCGTGQLSLSSDVYSFGIVLLQLVSAITDLLKLEEWKTVQLPGAVKAGRLREIADPKLNNDFVPEEMALMLTCAEACLRKEPKKRPSMTEVSANLENLDKLKVPKRGLLATWSGFGSTSPNK